jgi:hypothetical protein
MSFVNPFDIVPNLPPDFSLPVATGQSQGPRLLPSFSRTDQYIAE